MTIPIPENSITINGEIYVLVDDDESDECLRCALCEQCDIEKLLCQILDDTPQGKRFEKMEAKASPWKTVINGNPVPDTGRPVVGYWICGPEPFIEMVTHDPESGEWQDLDASGCEQHNVKEPDYWIDLPDYGKCNEDHKCKVHQVARRNESEWQDDNACERLRRLSCTFR